MSCPHCESADIRRSSAKSLKDKVMRLAGRWPYRCRTCRNRFYEKCRGMARQICPMPDLKWERLIVGYWMTPSSR